MLGRLLFLSVFIWGAVSGAASAISTPQAISDIAYDHPVPWPWGYEQPFPWTDIQGIWQVTDGDFFSYFAMKVVRIKSTGERQLLVRQIDARTCDTIAKGVGYEMDRVVRAQMTTLQGGAYRLALHAFSTQDSPRPIAGRIATSQVMVLSVTELESDSFSVPVDVQIGKMSASLDMKNCVGGKSTIF